MKAIITVVGPDRVGIIAEVCTLLAEMKISVVEISQTIMEDTFTMIMLVDLAECEMPFDRLSQHLRSVGEARGLAVHVQRQDIFDAMHRI